MPVAYIQDGQVVADTTATNTSASTKGTNQLGKDAFLQLLVTQMQNQDPLNPSSDTEFIAQLAQFSALEEMQNLNTSMSNQNAFGLVGKNVIISVGLSEGKVTNNIAGYVQYVEMKNGKAYLAINEELYSIDDLYTVIDERYLEAILNGDTSNDTEKEPSGDSETGSGGNSDSGDDSGEI